MAQTSREWRELAVLVALAAATAGALYMGGFLSPVGLLVGVAVGLVAEVLGVPRATLQNKRNAILLLLFGGTLIAIAIAPSMGSGYFLGSAAGFLGAQSVRAYVGTRQA